MSVWYLHLGLNIGASALYLGAGGLIARRLSRQDESNAGTATVTMTMAIAAALLHGGLLYAGYAASGELNLGFTSALSVVAWSVAVVFLVINLTRPVIELGIVVMPMAAIAILVAWIWPGGEQATQGPSMFLNTHITVSLLAYAFFTLAAVQAILLTIQERYLHQRSPAHLLRALPPIQTMETVLFQLITVGFSLLTLTLASGAVFSREIFGRPFVFNHHTVLSIIAWLVFGALLLGRWRLGWRGRGTFVWTLGGVTFLGLAYFGTKFVLEFVL